MASDLVKPGGEDGVGSEAGRVPGEADKNGLGDFFRKVRRANLAKGGGIDQIQVALYQSSESVIRAFASKLTEQDLVFGGHI